MVRRGVHAGDTYDVDIGEDSRCRVGVYSSHCGELCVCEVGVGIFGANCECAACGFRNVHSFNRLSGALLLSVFAANACDAGRFVVEVAKSLGMPCFAGQDRIRGTSLGMGVFLQGAARPDSGLDSDFLTQCGQVMSWYYDFPCG